MISSYQQFPTFFTLYFYNTTYICVVNMCLFSFLESPRRTFPKRSRIKGLDKLSFTIVNVRRSFPGGRRKWCRMKRKYASMQMLIFLHYCLFGRKSTRVYEYDLWINNWNKDRRWSHSVSRIWQQTLACGTLFSYLCVTFSDRRFLTSSHAASYVTYKDRQDYVIFPFSNSLLKLWLPW